MGRSPFRKGVALFRVIESAPVDHLKAFLLQPDANFQAVHTVLEPVFALQSDENTLRASVMSELNRMASDKVEPVEVECRRVLSLAEAKGPTSLETIIGRRLSHEECQDFDDQPGDLAKSLWAHARHRAAFDDAISFKSIRSWRDAGRIFAAFDVDLDGKGGTFTSADIDTEKLAKAIGGKLKTDQTITISLIDLPPVPDYPPSVLVIVRFPGKQASVATHGDQGERRLLYFRPQDEAVLIYTPADERIEIAAQRAMVRNAVANCFASETLGHDVSRKPLTAASYDTLRFLRSMDLPLPTIEGFVVHSARVIDLELRIENWQSRLSLKAAGKTEMSTLVGRYLGPGQALRRALGVSRVLMAIGFARTADEEPRVLEIMISDGNGCSLNSERDPIIRNFGRKLLASWGILQAFRDLGPTEAVGLLPVMAELWDLGETLQKGGYFSSRGIAVEPLEEARLIRRKEIEPKLKEEEDDPEVEGPTNADRTVYTIALHWVEERLKTTLKDIVDVVALDDQSIQPAFLGDMRIDDRDVPCYLARSLDQMKTFAQVDERLRAIGGRGPGIVFTGSMSGPSLIGANVVVPLTFFEPPETDASALRDRIEQAFRSGRSLALGVGTLELVEEEDGRAARLHFPGREPLDLFGDFQVRAFRLLVAAAKHGRPGVASGELISGSSSSGFQQMIGATRWPLVKTYVENLPPKRWKLSGY